MTVFITSTRSAISASSADPKLCSAGSNCRPSTTSGSLPMSGGPASCQASPGLWTYLSVHGFISVYQNQIIRQVYMLVVFLSGFTCVLIRAHPRLSLHLPKANVAFFPTRHGQPKASHHLPTPTQSQLTHLHLLSAQSRPGRSRSDAARRPCQRCHSGRRDPVGRLQDRRALHA